MSAFQIQFPKSQTEPPLSSRETLPTMYDLPSEDPEEPGLPDIELGLGLWRGEYQGITRLWMRWYDAEGNWILTDAEAAEQKAEAAEQKAALAQQEAETARQETEIALQEIATTRQEMAREQQKATEAEQRAEYLAQRLRELGIEI